jgi:hypothetical protein
VKLNTFLFLFLTVSRFAFYEIGTRALKKNGMLSSIWASKDIVES